MRSQEEVLEASEQKLGRALRGKWRLDRLVGVGGMAAVFAATRVDGRGKPGQVALKLLHPEIARSPELTRRFSQEATAAAHIKHPAAVLAIETDVAEDGCPFMVMELCEGESLLERMSRAGHIDPEELLRYMDELLDVLAVAHDAGIVHRDIKLDNLFIERSGRLRVLDFGIARVKSSSITVTGQRLGTIAYMPPEQVRGYEVDGRADLFSVGATMFRAIAKRRVHVAPNEAALLVMMSTMPAPSLVSVTPSTPPGVGAIVDRALAFYARERYPDARTMQLDVRAVREGKVPPYATKLAASPPTSPAAASAGAPPAAQAESFVDAPTVVPSQAAFDATAVAPASAGAPSGHPIAPIARDWAVGAQRAPGRSGAWVVPAVVGVALLGVALVALLWLLRS